MNTPLDHLEIIEQNPATRTTKAKMAKPTKTTHPFLFKKNKICEITGAMMTTSASLHTNQPKLKTGNEIWLLLGVENQLFLRKNVLSCQAKLQNYILFCEGVQILRSCQVLSSLVMSCQVLSSLFMSCLVKPNYKTTPYFARVSKI